MPARCFSVQPGSVLQWTLGITDFLTDTVIAGFGVENLSATQESSYATTSR